MRDWETEESTEEERLPAMRGWGGETDPGVALAPLVHRLERYDRTRQKLEQTGGRTSDLERLLRFLQSPFEVTCRGRTTQITLAKPSTVRDALYDAGSGVHMQVRQRVTKLPVYYLCRTRRDYWQEYGMVVEDLYVSPDYPMVDDRFVTLMNGSHETYFLRLSPLRERAHALLGEASGRHQLDDLLLGAGRHVFEAAWHEDQRLGVEIARHLGLPRFAQAIELLYLCLSGELCELRAAIDERMLAFFEVVYPQPAVRGFLELLTRLDGGAMGDLPQRALRLYARLSAAFNQFLSLQVPWGEAGGATALGKLCFANFPRIALVGELLRGVDEVREAAIKMDGEADEVIGRLLALEA